MGCLTGNEKGKNGNSEFRPEMAKGPEHFALVLFFIGSLAIRAERFYSGVAAR
jgi:hypothetical protein